ncbi:putative serine esterase-domain-containing protein [Thamnidium elegans]|nr:putative serine esterase-domain-containing protein [Thamnidium elegans]
MPGIQDISLIVLSHGLWGNKSHMGYIENTLQEKYGDAIHILNASVNEAKYTYDGIDICGRRLADEIESTVVRLGKNGKRVTRFSIIGYSLGGLITRYAVGLLGQRGFFNTIEPDYYISFATPHMGVKNPSKSFISVVFNFMSSRIISRSGEQLQLIDKFDKQNNKSMLEVLADPDQIYFQYLAKFKTRRTYINIANDRTVPYWTAGMEVMDYFFESKGKVDITLDESYKTLITAYDVKAPTDVEIKKTRKKIALKPVLLKTFFYCILPILGPIYFLLVLSLIGVQGLLSRYRSSKLLLTYQNNNSTVKSSESDATLDRRRSSDVDKFVDGGMLAGALDALNLPGDTSPPLKRSSSHHDGSEITEQDETAYYCKVMPGKALESNAKPLQLDQKTLQIHKNLNLLDWERVWVYIRGFNAHGSIVCRNNMYTTDAGVATIKHFIDTTQL